MDTLCRTSLRKTVAGELKPGSAAVLALLLAVGCAVPGRAKTQQGDSRIRVVEMGDDLTVFEVMLPVREANRKGVIHKLFDDQDTEIASQRFSTANGRYRIAMIATYHNGRAYRLVIDGTYQLKFRYQAET
jgi:hypothetical protein